MPAWDEQSIDILENLSEGFYALDGARRFTYVNRQAESMIGRPRTELLGRSIWDSYGVSGRNDGYEPLIRAGQERQAVEYEHFLPALQRWATVRVRPHGAGLHVYMVDIGERKALQVEIEE